MKARTIGMAAVVLLLAACDAGASPPRTLPPTTSHGATRHDFVSVEGKSFYLFRSGFTCGGQLPGTPTLASWVDRIEVHNGRLVRWGSRCGGEGLPLPPDEHAAARLSNDGTQLIVADKVYRISADPRHEAEVQP